MKTFPSNLNVKNKVNLALSNPDDAHRLLLRTFVVVQLAAATKICLQPCQNAPATKCVTNMASSDTDDDVISIAGVLLSGGFVNEHKKKN